MKELARVSNNHTSAQDAEIESSIRSAALSESDVTDYLSELVATATHLRIQVKDSARSEFRPMERLGELHVLMLHKHIWSAQISYYSAGSHWVDTLIIGPDTTRIVRVKDDDAATA